MSARSDENLNKVHEQFRQNHKVLREALMASLPESATKKKQSGTARRLCQLTGGSIMNSKIRKIALAAAILIAALLGIHFLGGTPDGASVAWANVLKNVESARTIMWRHEFEKGDDREVRAIRIKEPCLCRSDYVERGDPDTSGVSAFVIDAQTAKTTNFYPRIKLAVIGKEEGASFSMRDYENLKKDLRDGTEKDLGRVTLNGRDTICFEITGKNGRRTVWADPDTALPIQIETVSDENGRTRTLMSDIRFDVQLDEKLFQIPSDYGVLDLKTQELTTPFELTERHLVEGLAVYPRYLDGKFCTRYAGGRPLTDEVRGKCKAEIAKYQSWSEEESYRSTLGCAFIEHLPKDSNYQYVGEDVKFGDASKAVCWWKPVGSEKYRVIYGDLNIRDVEPNNLPPIPWLAGQK